MGNWGPGWNVGGTLILSATVVLRHRSPLPPPICSFHRSYGKRSCAHKNIHRRTYTRVSHTHTYVSDCPLLMCSFWVQLQCTASSSPNIPPPHLTKLASKFDWIPPASAPVSSHTESVAESSTVCVILHNIRLLPHILVDGRNLC